LYYKLYKSDGKSNLDHFCQINGKKLKHPLYMTRDEINEELDSVNTRVMKRIEDNLSNFSGFQFDYYTTCESERIYDLKLALPNQNILSQEARDRNLQRRKSRKNS
jgi:hypothetical protein